MRRLTISVLLVAVACGLVACDHEGVTVTVANETASAVTNVALIYEKGKADGVASLGTIQPGRAAKVHIIYNHNSLLFITFRGGDGSQQRQQIDVYLQDSHAPIKLRIMRDYVVRCEGC